MVNIKAYLVGTLSILFALAFIVTSGFAGQQQKVTLRVDGLACPFCAYGMEKKLKRIENLEKLDIEINEGLVILYFKEEAKIDKDLIIKKVKEAGFTPRELKIEGESKQVAGQPDAIKGQKISLNIKGMSCEGCVSRVKTTLNNLDCVKDVDVDLSAEKATFTCTDEKVNQVKFVQAVEKLGFKANISDKKSE